MNGDDRLRLIQISPEDTAMTNALRALPCLLLLVHGVAAADTLQYATENGAIDGDERSG
jgi:hypothetical protein